MGGGGGAGSGAAGAAGGGAGAGGGSAGAGGTGVGGNTFCFPGPIGVPGQSGLPDWWLGTAPFDDARWAGSFQYSYGGLGNGEFNALVDRTGQPAALVLRWRVTADTSPASNTNQVWVGFYNRTSGVATVLRITNDVATTATAGTTATGALDIAALQETAPGAGWSSVSVPAGVTADARLDAICTTAQLPSICSTWAIRLRVPMTGAAGGIDLNDSFKMWFELNVQGDTAIVADKWPLGAIQVDPTALPLTFPEPLGSTSPASLAWNDVSANGGTCAPGVNLQPGDISVSNQIGAGTTIDVAGANTFHIKPLNQTQALYAPNAIQASLRIADWRAGIGDSPLWLALPDASCASATGPATGTVGTGQRFDLVCTWTPTAAQACDYRPDLSPGCTTDAVGSRFAQQGILVELSSAVGVPFASGSAAATLGFAAH